MRFVDIPLHNLQRRPWRSGFTVLGVTVAVASFIALVGLSRGLEQAWINNLVERGIHMLVIRKGAVELLTASADEGMAARLGRVEGVREAAGELVNLIRLESGNNVLVKGWPRGSFLWETLRLREGRLPRPQDAQGVVLGPAAADSLHRKPGDTVRVGGTEFVVTGISASAGAMSNNTLMLPLPALQKMIERPGKVTGFNLRLDHPEDPQAVAMVKSRLKRAFPDFSCLETQEIADQNDVLRMFRALTWGTSVIALVLALIVVLNTLLMSVTERTREIGVWSAIGWQPGRILAMMVIEGLVLAGIGSAAGLAVGLMGLYGLVRLPPLHGLFEPQVTFRLILEIVGVVLLLGGGGSLYPAWRAAHLHPVEALKHE